MRILFFDQDGLCPAQLAARLAHTNHELSVAHSLEAALVALREGSYALALTSAADPQADAFTLAAQAHADTRIAPLVILVVLPDDASAALTVQAYRSGATDVVPASLCELALEHKLKVFSGFDDERQHLAELAASLDQALKVNELCAAMLAHDLRNPITAVLAAAEILQRAPQPEVVSATAQRLGNSGRRMQAMVDRLLYVARMRAGTLRMRFGAFDLAALVRDIVDEFTDASAQGRISLAIRGDTELEADGGALGHVLSNLLGNALRYGERDGAVHIDVDGDAAEFVRLRVANAGALSAEVRRNMCAAQPILHGGAGAGAGLGLYIVHQLVTLHGGSVEIDSDATTGTAITVTIPRRAATAADERAG